MAIPDVNCEAEFKRERNEALLSMDEEKIRGMVRKWNGIEMQKNPASFWLSVHKAITGNKDLPLEFRNKSKAWLNERGFHSWDDGELTGKV